MRLVVTGASGLIGSELLQIFPGSWDVHAVSRNPRMADAPNRKWHRQDLARLDPQGLPGRVDAVIYLAQSEHFREFPDRAADIAGVNIMGLLRCLDYALRSGAKKFIYASSGGVYGSGDASMSEDIAVPADGNLGFYLGTKLCSEILGRNYARFMDLTVLRFFFVYGPRQRRTMLIPRLIDNVRNGKPVTLQGQEGLRLNPVFVADAAAAVNRALDLGGAHTINIAGPEVLSLREICEIIGSLAGRRPVFAVEPASPRHIIGDISKMTQLLLAPTVTFRQGLQRMLQG